MEIFEFHFNNKEIEDIVFDSLAETKNNKKGSLFTVSQISNAYPKSQDLLKEINASIQDNFYTEQNDSKQSFKTALIKANSLLKNKVKNNETDWLGNLNFAALNIKDDLINFVKLGGVKILLLRGGEIFDISDNLENQGNITDPGSYFLNIAIGKLSPGDNMIITTPNLYDVLQEQGILNEVANLEKWNQKDLSSIFKDYKEELRGTKGMTLMISFDGQPIKETKLTMPKLPTLPNFNIDKKKIAIALAIPAVLFAGYYAFLNFKPKEIKKTDITAKIQKEEVKEEIIKEPEVSIPALYSFSNDNFIPKNIIVINDAIYAYNDSGKEFYKINLKDLKTVKSSTNYNFSDPVIGDNSIYFFIKPNTIVEHITTKDIIGSQDLTIDSQVKIDNISYYNGKLYFLDTTDGSIYKKSKETIVIWGNDNKIKDAKSFTIDGNVWVLRQPNKIDKYFQGKLEKTIEVQGLVNAKKIWTARGIDNIYILDQDKVVIADQEGNIIKEYKDYGFKNLTDFFIENGTIYLVNETEIYKLD